MLDSLEKRAVTASFEYDAIGRPTSKSLMEFVIADAEKARGAWRSR
ncbi:MAG: hypothetical protein ACRD09_15935 [Vicinamibacterales bacterium]